MTKSIEEISRLHLCHRCIGEDFFSAEVRDIGKVRNCGYCKRERRGIRLAAAADRIEEILERHYQPAAMNPNWLQVQMLKDRDSTYEFYPSGEPTNHTILNMAGIPEDAANHIQAILHERHRDWDMWAPGEITPYADDLNYEEAPINDEHWHHEWREFEQTLKTETRFFNRKGDDLLKRIFEGIENLRTREGEGLIVDSGPETDFTHFFRAREFQDEEALEAAMMRPDRFLGPPPSHIASSGRMNALGVAIFYGATEPEVAVSEVRPAVGSQVLIGRFEITRPLRLLNLSKLSEVARRGSLFDRDFSLFLERAKFLQSFTQQMSRPVMPSHEALEYLPTQAVADFLASMEDPAIDGIVFPSVQSGYAGQNVALFHKASRVDEIDLSDGTTLEADTWQMYNEGPERGYWVVETTPESSTEDESENSVGSIDLDPCGQDESNWHPTSYRPISLSVDTECLQVRIIKQTNYDTENYRVHRIRHTDQEPPF